MFIKKITSFFRYALAEDESIPLKRRLLLSSLLMGSILCVIDIFVNHFLLTSVEAQVIPFFIAIVAVMLFYYVRFKSMEGLFSSIAIFIIITVVWLFKGGINGSNNLISLVILLVAMTLVSDKSKIYVLIFYISINFCISFIQLKYPEMSTTFSSERKRIIDYLITLVLCSGFLFFIIKVLEKNYSRERLRAEESERNFKSLSENSLDHISRFDRQLRHLYINRAGTELLGLPLDKILGKTYSELEIANRAQYMDLEDILETVFTLGTPISTQVLIEKDITKTYLDFRIFPEFDEHSNVISILCVSRDISVLKQTEIALSQTIADKDRFISILAHDIKNPFNSILGFSDLLSANFREYDIEKTGKMLKIINQTAIFTNDLLDEILVWGRAHSGSLPYKPQYIQFQDLILMVIEPLSANIKNKNISITSNTETLIVFADKNMLKTIMRNFITNAIKFTNIGGQIIISAKQDKDFVTITVSDNGVGIDKTILENLFTISKVQSTPGTSNEQGTGLGLLICNEFVHRHGGKIWVESQVNKGSDFSFSLPNKLMI